MKNSIKFEHPYIDEEKTGAILINNFPIKKFLDQISDNQIINPNYSKLLLEILLQYVKLLYCFIRFSNKKLIYKMFKQSLLELMEKLKNTRLLYFYTLYIMIYYDNFYLIY